MAENKAKAPFVSAIKVKGIHLLPPVLSPKRRAEMQKYRQQAVKLEKRLQNFRDLKKNLQDLLNFQPLSDRPQSEITFRDNSHIEALGITESGSIFPQKIKTPRKIRLSKDIIDVTQYDSDGIKILQNDSKSDYSDVNQGYQLSLNNSNETYESDTSLNKSADIIPLLKPTDRQVDLNNSCINSEQGRLLNLTEYRHSSESDNVSVRKSDDFHLDSLSPEGRPSSERSPRRSPVKSPKPRLIRSNSYTLESPSPILLAHMEKNGKMEELASGYQPKQFTFTRNWSSLENNYVPFENSEFSSINTVYNAEDSTDKANVTHKSTPSGGNRLEKSASPTIEVIQTDISVQQINISTNDETITNEGKFCDMTDPDSQLMQVLCKIPENYSKQIIELIQKQRSEQQKRVQKFDEVKSHFTDSPRRKQDTKEPETDDNGSPTVPRRHASRADFSRSSTSLRNDSRQSSRHPSASLSDSERLHDFSMSMSPTQSIYYSVGSSDTLRPLNSPSVKLIDLEYDDEKTEDEKFDSPKKLARDIDEVYIQEQVRSDLSVSRELFPNMDASTLELIKQKWAASVIGAHVKGYLTRRLLKTERVQSLIDTIKDALMCALQLHNADNIDESDVELHRRLINQVSAACYTFHDIFFSLSAQEQMSIISMDRQRKLEKAKRPSSAPALRRTRSSTGRTTSKHKISPQSQSLTKV